MVNHSGRDALIIHTIKQYKKEILNDLDWWHGFDDFSINVFDYSEKGVFTINAYEVGEDGKDDYGWTIYIGQLTKEELENL